MILEPKPSRPNLDGENPLSPYRGNEFDLWEYASLQEFLDSIFGRWTCYNYRLSSQLNFSIFDYKY